MLARAVRARRRAGTGALGSLCPWGERPAGVAGGAAPRSWPFLFPRARRVLWSLPPAPGRARHVPRVCRACADGPRASEQASCSVRSVRWVVRTCGAGSWRIGPVSLASGSGSEVFPALRNQPRLVPGHQGWSSGSTLDSPVAIGEVVGADVDPVPSGRGHRAVCWPTRWLSAGVIGGTAMLYVT